MRHLRDSKHDYRQDAGREELTMAIRDNHHLHLEYRRRGHHDRHDRHRDDRRDGYHESREERRRRERSSDYHRHDRRPSESPPLSPRVTILKHSANPPSQKNSTINHQLLTQVNSNSVASGSSAPVHIIQSNHHNASGTSMNHQPQQPHTAVSHMPLNIEEMMTDMIENMPPVMKLIDPESWSFFEHTASDFLFGDNISPNGGGFTVISAVGTQSVGKSSLLNKIAGRNVFKTHNDSDTPQSYLKHLTRGVDLHVTKERHLLLDCQPVMTASILDEYINKNTPCSTNVITDALEPEIYVYITSLQLLSFLIAVCDYVIVLNDWVMDIHLIKLLATAMMMVGTEAHRAELIFHFPQLKEENRKKVAKTIRTLFGGDYSLNIIKDVVDETISLPKLMKLLSRKPIPQNERNSIHSSERSWLVSAQRFWENSVRKSSLFSDYARLML